MKADSGNLIEQYKLYVEMADRISQRRVQTNRFFISVLSGLIAFVSIFVQGKIASVGTHEILLAVAILGIVLDIIWFIHIRSYRQLNTAKFEVIHEMEKELPFACYSREWEHLGKGKDRKKYYQLTRIEKYVPFVLTIPFLFFLVFSIYRFAGC